MQEIFSISLTSHKWVLNGEDRTELKKRNDYDVTFYNMSCIFRKDHCPGVSLSVNKADNNIFSKLILLSYLLHHSLLAGRYQH